MTASAVEDRALITATATDAAPSLPPLIQKMFFNRTPTVSFDPSDATVQPDGTTIGTVRGLDEDGDVLAYTADPTTGGATVTINAGGTFTYVPVAEAIAAAPDSFTITVSDDTDGEATQVHGLLGLLIPAWGSTATTNVAIARPRVPTEPTEPTLPTSPTLPTLPTSAALPTLPTDGQVRPGAVIPWSAADVLNPKRGQYNNLNEGLFPQSEPPQSGYPAWPGAYDAGTRDQLGIAAAHGQYLRLLGDRPRHRRSSCRGQTLSFPDLVVRLVLRHQLPGNLNIGVPIGCAPPPGPPRTTRRMASLTSSRTGTLT